MSDVKSFITNYKNSPRAKGKLDPWESEIFELVHAKIPQVKIVEWLNQQGVTVTPPEIHLFIHRKKRAALLNPIETTPPLESPAKAADDPAPPASKKQSNAAEVAPSVSPVPMAAEKPAPGVQAMAKDEPEKEPVRQHALPKFDWQALKEKTKDIKW